MAAPDPSPSKQGPQGFTIGEVLNQLKEDFEDITISKIRFLESEGLIYPCLLYTSPSPRDGLLSRMPSSA